MAILDEFILLNQKKFLFFYDDSSKTLPILKWQKKYDVIKDYIKKPITANKLELLCKLIGEMRFPGNISKLVPY
jgi:hypothetical protein